MTENEVHVLAWNPHVSNDPERIETIVEENLDWADYFALNEVRRFFAFLGRMCQRLGLVHLQEQPDPYGAVVSEKGSSALVVNRSIRHKASNVIVLARRWKVFSHNRWHFGRRLGVQVGRKAGRRIKVVVVHGPTNGPAGGNRWAYAEFLSVLARLLLTTRPGTVLIIVGDFNGKREDLVRWINTWPLSALGLSIDGRNVDWCVVRGGRVSARVGESKRGSDHYPIWYTIVLLEKKIGQVRKFLARRKEKR